MAANDAELKITATLDDQVTKAIEKLAGEVRDLGDQAKKSFDSVSTAASKTEAAVEDTGAAAKKTKTELKGAGEEGSKGFDKLKGKIGEVATSLIGIGTAVAIFKQSIGDAITTAADIDVINARIQNFTGTTGAAFGQLAADLRTLSLVNKDFIKEQEVSQAALVLLKEGFSTTSTVIYDVAEAIDFARVNGVTLAQATKLLTETQKALGDETKNSTELFSRLNLLFANGFDDAGQLAGALDALANTARQSGLSLDDATASLATLSEQTKASEALKNLETILKTLQSRTAEVDEIFNQAGKSFDRTTVSTAGLRNTLVALLEGIAASGGDAQEELKKLFGSQEAVNSVLQLAAKDGTVYAQSVEAVTRSLSKLNSDTNTVRGASDSFIRALSGYGDFLPNVAGSIENLDGTVENLLKRLGQFRKANAEGARSVTISTGEIAAGVGRVRSATDTLGPAAGFASDLAASILEVGNATKVSQSSIDAWFSTVSGEVVDADLKRINDEVQRLTKQALEFGTANVEGFDTEGIKFRLQEIADYEQLLIDELAAKRKAETDKATADKEQAVLKAAEAEARSIEDLAIQRAQADKEEFDRRIRQAQEVQRLTQDLVRSAMGGGESSFVTSIESQARDLGAEISKLQGRIANETLSEEELGAVLARIDLLKAGITQLTEVSIKSGEALGAGFAETINTKVKDALNTYQTGVELAQSVSSTFTNTLSGLFNDLVLGSKSASQAFKDFIRGLIAGLVQAINQAIASKIVASILASIVPGGAPIAAASGGVVSGSMGTPKTFAKGGIMAGAMMAGGLPMHSYAEGGVARSPQVAIFGEGKGAEAFVPLPGPNRGIPVEFKSMPSGGNITINYNPSIQALDGNSTKEVLLREARVIGDIIASEIATGSNRSLTDVVRSRATRA